MATWTDFSHLYEEELTQRKEEGVDLSGFLKEHEGIPQDRATVEKWYDELMALPISPDFPYEEPISYQDILAACPAPVPVEDKEIPFDKFYGAWLGRGIGNALGIPVETGWGFGGKDGIPGWKLVMDWYKGADAFPVHGYTPGHSRLEKEQGVGVHSPEAQAGTIRCIPSDDDIRYTVLGHKILRTRGLDFTTMDVAESWLWELPCHQCCTAERQAYINLSETLNMKTAGASEEEVLDYVRTYRNPYREWIGAQIRVDGFAFAAAGLPDKAADFAYRDAALSHVKNGVYGEMFFGAVIAAAFVESDIHKLIDIGLAHIPAKCRLAEDIRKTVEYMKVERGQEEMYAWLWENFGCYAGAHTLNNACLCVAALLYGKGDFETAVTAACLGGWDTDCNAATVGSVMGAITGAEKIPECWKGPLNDTLESLIIDYHPIAISECARQSVELNKKLRENL